MADFAGQWGPEGLEYPNGYNAANVQFTVKTLVSGVAIPLWEDKDRLVSLANPGFTDDLGNIYFFANPGSYRLEVAGKSFTVTVNLHPDEQLSGGGGGQGFVHSQPTSVSAVSITHGLGFAPAGIVCLDLSGNQVDQDRIAQPEPGVTEVFFDPSFSFSGTIYLS